MRILRLVLPVALLACTIGAAAQSTPRDPYYSRKNTFGIFSSYSNDSSHILLGYAENRRLLEFGGVYSRRLWIGRMVNWQYDAEILPIVLESDPVIHEVTTFTSPDPSVQSNTFVPVYACHASSGSYSQTIDGVTYSYSYVNSCARRWTIGEGISPVGFQWNFLPRRKFQPFLEAHGGYMYSTTPIPITAAGSFNFTFDFGGGVELFKSRSKSVRAGFRYHHISNHQTATANPGIDNAVVQITYAFGH